MDVMRLIADRKIEEAMAEGRFDNLPGKGKPLSLDYDPTLPPHLRAAATILRNSGESPEHVLAAGEIATLKHSLSTWMAKTLREYQKLAAMTDHALMADWLIARREEHERILNQIHTLILQYYLTAPSAADPIQGISLVKERDRFNSLFGRLPQYERSPSTEDASKVRADAYYRYHKETP